MNDDKNIFGCFFKVGFDPSSSADDFSNLARSFRSYIWGKNRIGDMLKKLSHEDYGNDLKLAVFQFYVKPTAIELQRLKDIEPYRAKEKSIGIPIIVEEDNFFRKSENERNQFLKNSVLQKLELLHEVVKKKKLDTNMESLKIDVEKVLSDFGN